MSIPLKYDKFRSGCGASKFKESEICFFLGKAAISKRRSIATTRREISERKSSNGRRAAKTTFGT